MTSPLPPGARVVSDALSLARERVTGDDVAAKKRRRDEIDDLISRISDHYLLGHDFPLASEVLAVLGDDDPAVRHALAAWPG